MWWWIDDEDDDDYDAVCAVDTKILIASINQSINQSKRIYIAPYVAGESEARLCIALFKVLIFIVDKYANYDLHVPRLPMHWRRSSLSGFSDDWKLLRSCRLDFTALACCVEWHALWLCRACSCVYLVKEIMTVYSCKAKWVMLVIRDTVWPVYSLTNLNFCTPLPVKGN